ncbi:MAG: hypothetical protein GXY15_09320 [Candidatus Hydrogenedentes bacterium]|nr:hypothetical protein [Candidatus Hydrogenedentota bacterium]
MPARFLALALLLCPLVPAAAQTPPPVAYTLEETVCLPAPGNVFLTGVSVRIPVPAAVAGAADAVLLDDAGREVATGTVTEGVLTPEPAPGVGWYQVVFRAADGQPLGWTTAAVLDILPVPLPEDSPVALDVALSWVAPDSPEAWRAMTHIAALAGVRWVRDRLRWREVEPEEGRPAESTRYDATADLQSGAGLKLLQVFHDMPPRVRDADGVPDLRRLHAFCRLASARFGARVPAWEPWNEANAKSFGGWPGSDICAWQKAACLGFKAGRPETLVFWQPIAGVNTPGLVRSVLENETWPYFDVYAMHSYDWCHDYDRLWAGARDAASGRPVWVTESDRGIASPPGMPHLDLPPADAALKAQFVAQEYAQALAAGAEKCFHFILGQYKEEHGGNRIQFGLLREDMTPRPGYVALANLGRRLAGTRCLGAWTPPGQPDTRVVAFRSPEGADARDVVVVWAERPVDWAERGKCEAPWPLPADFAPGAVCHDCLGRAVQRPDRAVSAPVFLTCPRGAADALPLTPPPAVPRREGEPLPVVLQLSFPGAEVVRNTIGWTDEHDYALPAGKPAPVRMYAYNFGDSGFEGELRAESLPEGWTLTPDTLPLRVAPGGRVPLDATLTLPEAPIEEPEGGHWVKLRAGIPQGPTVAARILVK